MLRKERSQAETRQLWLKHRALAHELALTAWGKVHYRLAIIFFKELREYDQNWL